MLEDNLIRIAILLLIVGGACGSPSRAPTPATPAPVNLDPDRDRVEGAADQCPNEPEVYNGTDDEDGCPDRGGATDCVWNDVIEIMDRVFFDPGSAEIRDPSLPIVQAVAETILGNPRVEKLGVVGARDASEPVAVAQQRADAMVAALVARGVSAARFETHAWPHTNGEAAKNRVVWFVMLRIDGAEMRPPNGDARWMPWQRDCAASWKAHRERGEMLDCDCKNAGP